MTKEIKVVYRRPLGISKEELQESIGYLKECNPNWGKKYRVVVSYHCQGDFCKRYYKWIEIDKNEEVDSHTKQVINRLYE